MNYISQMVTPKWDHPGIRAGEAVMVGYVAIICCCKVIDVGTKTDEVWTCPCCGETMDTGGVMYYSPTEFEEVADMGDAITELLKSIQ